MLKKSVALLGILCATSACAFNLDDLKGKLNNALPQQAQPTQAAAPAAQPASDPLANISNKDQISSSETGTRPRCGDRCIQSGQDRRLSGQPQGAHPDAGESAEVG